jgi:hypothetical protein
LFAHKRCCAPVSCEPVCGCEPACGCN